MLEDNLLTTYGNICHCNNSNFNFQQLYGYHKIPDLERTGKEEVISNH